MTTNLGAPIFMRLVRYGLVGAAGTILYTALVVALVELVGIDPVWSSIDSFAAVIAITYLCNRTWVFRSSRDHRHSFPRFVLVCILGFVLNTTIMYVTVYLLGWRYGVGIVCTTAVVPPTNYLLHQYWSFR